MECTVQNCTQPQDGRSYFCLNHKRNKIRHGHPTQESVSSFEIATYRKTVRARIAKNSHSPVWTKIEEHWLAVVRKTQEHAEACLMGRPKVKYQSEAWGHLARLGQNVEPRAVIEVALAMYLMQEWNPHRFNDDRAFGFQLVRRIRSLDHLAVGTTWDDKLKKVKRVYRDVKPRTTEIIAEVLQHTFGVAGLTVARLEAKEREQQQTEQEAFHDGLAALT
jgi:hypothetical protein